MNHVSVLDHGYVKLLNISGPTRRSSAMFDANDVDPAQAARMSFDQSFSDRPQTDDLRLGEYLLKNLHTTPWEMITVWFEMKLPIFLARQFVRHRTVTINEVSARYVQLPGEWYLPELQDVVLQHKDKKQGGALADLLDSEQRHKAEAFRMRLQVDCRNSYRRYQESIYDGIAMEQARMHLHVNHYTHWIWKQDLHNLMHFLSLRSHSHAQREAQYFAIAIIKLLRQVLPYSMNLFERYRARGE